MAGTCMSQGYKLVGIPRAHLEVDQGNCFRNSPTIVPSAWLLSAGVIGVIAEMCAVGN